MTRAKARMAKAIVRISNVPQARAQEEIPPKPERFSSRVYKKKG
jgi:hypothetical protein